MEIYCLRHGESLADLEHKIESRYDAPLTAAGIEQARQAGTYFKSQQVTFDSIVSSPLLRAKTTADIIAEALGVPMTLEPDLAEVDRGILCGLLRTEADEKYPRKSYRTHYDRYPESSGESMYEVKARTQLVLQKLFQQPVKNLLVVSHGSFLNELLGSLFMMPSSFNEATGTVFSFGNCEYVHLRKKEDSDRVIVLEKRIARMD